MNKVDIDAVKSQNPLAPTVERLCGQAIVKHKICCPFHEESTPSLHVYEDGGWKCFGCGLHGDVLDFVGLFYFGQSYDPSTHFIDVVDRLGALDIAPLPPQPTKPKPARPRLKISLQSIVSWHESMPETRREYWRSRGLTDQTISEFMLGFDGQRYTIPALYRLIPFGVKRRKADDLDDGKPEKYTSAYGSIVGIFNSDTLLSCQSVVICEGEIDTMLLHQSGIQAVSSTGGAGSWKERWAEHFTHIPRIFVLYDNDEAGQKGALKVQASIRRAQILTLPDGIKDVGELFQGTASAADWVRWQVGK